MLAYPFPSHATSLSWPLVSLGLLYALVFPRCKRTIGMQLCCHLSNFLFTTRCYYVHSLPGLTLDIVAYPNLIHLIHW
ncbi:hypothetical protein BDY19DRAFT_967891 [Irpex rosettiformis]|uniref:Uncharacterized protein n=1 Tax=Irpex rosettiformis TaxID=378272 RepID=A0ACB8TST8_9APHY|nr:hypothetical protein BDY19DRAFT_967891 [Irpex rosettiformis]